MIGTSRGPGNDSISTFLPASMITQNVLAGGNAGSYPGGNAFPSTAQFEAQFVSYSSGDYRLIAGSPWHNAATDTLDLGAVFGAAPAAAAAPSPAASAPTAPSASPAPPRQGESVSERPWLDQQ
jgi:hypothetical protein